MSTVINLRPCPFCGSTHRSVKFVESSFLILRCHDCSLVYHGNPPGNGSIYEDYYDLSSPSARKYHDHSDDPALAELFAINTQRVLRIKQIKSTGRLLDIGCGRGMFLKTARDHGFTVAGIDISGRAVAYAQTEFDLDAKVLTPDELVSANARYDVVTLWHVLEHFLDPLQGLAQIRSLLVSDGLCVVEVPNLLSVKFFMTRNKWEGGNHPLYHRTFFTARTLRRMLLKAGFSEVDRVRLSYRIPGRNRAYEAVKQALNLVGADAFLAFAARK